MGIQIPSLSPVTRDVVIVGVKSGKGLALTADMAIGQHAQRFNDLIDTHPLRTFSPAPLAFTLIPILAPDLFSWEVSA